MVTASLRSLEISAKFQFNEKTISCRENRLLALFKYVNNRQACFSFHRKALL